MGKFIATAVTAAQLLGWVAFARASEEPPPALPSPDEMAAVRRSLREFDRFLDHHPLIEESLRLRPGLAADAHFLEHNPELQSFLAAHPQVPQGLKVYPRYFLNRALLRQASAPLPFADLAPLRHVFEQSPDLERQLARHPESIRDTTFLAQHAELRDCLHEHPALGRVFLPREAGPGPRR